MFAMGSEWVHVVSDMHNTEYISISLRRCRPIRELEHGFRWVP